MDTVPSVPDDEWTRDVVLMLEAWPFATLAAIVLLFTVVRGAFV